MQKFKRTVAVALAATMVIGSSVTAFAEDTTSGSSTGTGSNEGHLNTHVIDVVLPTVEAGSTPFAYTMDLERLIQQTDHAKYANATFPAANSDTGVYFATEGTPGTESYDEVTSPDVADIGTYYEKTTTNTDVYTLTEDTSIESGKTYYTQNGTEYEAVASPDADDIATYYEKSTESTDSYALTTDTALDGSKTYYTKTTTGGTVAYANTSEALEVTSRSSADVKLTVQVAASQQSSDVTLVETAPAADETDAQLYLALKVDDTTTAIKAGETVSKEVTIAGKDSNFEASVVNGAYAYTVIDDPAAWNKSSFSITGAASKASAEGLTAPTLTVTWRYEDPTGSSSSANEGAAVFGDDNVVAGTRGTSLAMNYTEGTGDKAIDEITDIVVTLDGGTTKSILTDGEVQKNGSGEVYVILQEGTVYISRTATSYMPYDSDISITYDSVGGDPVTVTVKFTEAE